MASNKNRGLGRGLDALFADAPAVEKEESTAVESKEVVNSVVYIDVHSIKPNRNQPRKTFDDEKIDELANSIKEHGIIQPIVVRKLDVGYEIVAGERRWRASIKAELKKVPCIIKELNDEENMLLAIIENMQREDLNPIEEAEGINQMIITYGLTQEQISKSVGKSRPYITNSLRLLKLPKEIQMAVSQGDITMGHARALINIKEVKKQLELCKRIKAEGLSVREIEKISNDERSTTKKRPMKKAKDPDTLAVEEELKTALGTKVQIQRKGKKGKIEIDFYSSEELERLIELLKIVN